MGPKMGRKCPKTGETHGHALVNFLKTANLEITYILLFYKQSNSRFIFKMPDEKMA